MMHSHLDFESSRQRAVDMRREVERNRLKSRLAEAHRSTGALPEELSPQRRGMVARSATAVMALFR
jgi:hypothetical protein